MPSAVLTKQELTALVEEQIHLYQDEDNQIKIIFSKPPEPVFVDADSGLIRQVFANLFQNSIDNIFNMVQN